MEYDDYDPDSEFQDTPKATTSRRKQKVEEKNDKTSKNDKNEEPQDFMGKMSAFFHEIWQTRDTENTEENRELYIKTSLREMLIYILFIITLLIITYGTQTSLHFYLGKTVQQQFQNFSGNNDDVNPIASIPDLWNFLQNDLVNGLYGYNQYYNGMDVPDSEQNTVLYENRLLGVPRIRQVRVKNDSCTIAADFKAEVTLCYNEYNTGAEDKKPFGLMDSTAWNYTDSASLGGQKVSGFIMSYPAGGFYVDLNTTMNGTATTLSYLFDNNWIDRGTRMVVIEFPLYNPNLNMFSYVLLIAELPATGGIIATSEFRTVKLLRYVSPMDFFVMATEIFFMLFLVYYSVEEAIEIKKHKVSYFTCIWNLMDIAVILGGYVCIVFNIYRTIAVQSKINELLEDETMFLNFGFLSFWQMQFEYAVAFLSFVVWIKVFKYISFNKTMSQLSATMDKCSQDLAGFGLMFLIVYFAFAQLGYLLFSAQVKLFQSFTESIYTLFRIILGDFDFSELDAANRIIGPLYFITYVFFVFFVLINMFLAIVNDSYAVVKEELKSAEDEYAFGDFFRQKAGFLMQKLNLKKEKVIEMQNAINSADVDGDGKINYDEFRNQLIQRGYSSDDIAAIFSKYDKDGDQELGEYEQNLIQKELENQKDALTSEINETENEINNQHAKPEEVEALRSRIAEMGDYIIEMTEQIKAAEDKFTKMNAGGTSPRPTAAAAAGLISRTKMSLSTAKNQ